MKKTRPLCPQCGEPCVKKGNSRGVQRWGHKVGNACSWHGTRPVGLDAPAIDTKAIHSLVHNAKGPQRYLITSAQNATAVNLPFFRSLLTYCRINKAKLLVVPYRYKNPCLAPETKVLTADLRYVSAGELSVGDKLVGFEADINGRGNKRKYKEATVTSTGRAMMPAYRVILDDGTSIVASEDHPWLVDEGKHRWRKTKDLIHQKGGARIVRLFDVWETHGSRESGYIAAALDGEGSLIQQPDLRGGWQLHLTYCQKPNAMSAEFGRCMALFGVKLGQYNQKNGCYTWTIHGGTSEIVRVLGQHRPLRMLAKLCVDKLGSVKALRLQKVVSCDLIGPREVVTLSTTSETLIAEGLATHNTSIWSKTAKDDDWWAPELVPYLIDRRTKLCKGLVLLADIKTQPTASRPLQGFESITGGDSAIIGHPKIELSTIATPQHKLAKILTTTGGVTAKNYLPGKAGKKGEHHHTFGACVVEMADGLFHLRHINAGRDGSFQDLARSYNGETCNPANVEALVMGDTHEEVVDPDVVKATFTDKNSIVKALKPKHLVWHDVHDFYSKNHHHRGEPIINYVKHHSGADNVERALDKTFAFIDRMTPPGAKNVFVPSNHPDALARWIKESDPRSDPENCVFWARTFEAMCLGSKMTETGATTIDPFAFWAMKKLKTAKQAVFLRHDQGFSIKGIECGFHGHFGPNGSRGSRKGFSQIGVKTIIGHSHVPGVTDGCLQVGTSSRLKLEYIKGPSSHAHAHGLIYENGKRTLVFIVHGRWRG